MQIGGSVPDRSPVAAKNRSTHADRRIRPIRILRGPSAKHFRPFIRSRDRNYRNRLSKFRGRHLGLCGQRLPELNLIPIQVIDPGKATVGFIHSFGVNLYSLLL